MHFIAPRMQVAAKSLWQTRSRVLATGLFALINPANEQVATRGLTPSPERIILGVHLSPTQTDAAARSAFLLPIIHPTGSILISLSVRSFICQIVSK